jgi:hypothetical protein
MSAKGNALETEEEHGLAARNSPCFKVSFFA